MGEDSHERWVVVLYFLIFYKERSFGGTTCQWKYGCALKLEGQVFHFHPVINWFLPNIHRSPQQVDWAPVLLRHNHIKSHIYQGSLNYQPKRCTMKGKSLTNYHSFALMIPASLYIDIMHIYIYI